MSYETAQEMFDALCVPFPTAFIKWRIGNKNEGGVLPLCYVDARAVMDRLDSVCGMDGWRDSYAPSNGMVFCSLSIRMPNGEWITKSDGAGATDFEGEKGMVSDALKRAAVRFGVGRYLYDMKIDRMPSLDVKELNKIHDEKAQEWGWDIGYRPGAYAYRVMVSLIENFVTDNALAQEFKKKNASHLQSMPVRMRERIIGMLDRVGASQAEAAE